MEDWHGEVCADHPSVMKVEAAELGSLDEVAITAENLLWSHETFPIVEEPIFSVRGAVTIPASDGERFLVLSSRPNGVIALEPGSGRGVAWWGGMGDGPGEFSVRVQDIWVAGFGRVAVYDPGGHRVTWISVEGGVDSVRALPATPMPMVQHRLVGGLSDGGLIGFGFRIPGPPEPPEGGDVQAWYRMGRYSQASAGWRWEHVVDVPGIVQFISAADPPPQVNMGQSPFRPDSQLWTDSTGIWLANGHWPLLRRFTAEGASDRTLWLELDRRRVTEDDRRRFIDWHAERASANPDIIARRRALAETFNFPGSGPYFHEAVPMGEELWLRVSEDEWGGWGSRWLVLDATTFTPHRVVAMPHSALPLARSGDVLLARGRGLLGEVELQAYRMGLAGS